MTENAVLETQPARLTTAEVAHALGVDQPPADSRSLASIDEAQLDRLAGQIAADIALCSFSPATWDDPLFWNSEGTRAERSQYFAVGNAINFRFWQLVEGRVMPASGLIEGTEYRGAMYMWRSLRRCLEQSLFPILDPGALATLTSDEFDAVFRDDRGMNPLAPAKDERIANLRDLGQVLVRDWGGAFFNVLDASGGSLVAYAHSASRFRAFDDPVFKLTMVNAILHSGSGVFRFSDEPLPGIDYHLLRHLLRQGVLRPNRRLTEKLMSRVLLSNDEALALRRVALSAFVQLSARTEISGEVLDNKFWLNRVNCADTDPVCSDLTTAHICPFYGPCKQLVGFALPLEETRYY